MELKIHVDQTVRIVCGLDEATSVQDVILALAQALKQTGRFYLVESCSSGRLTRPNRTRVMAPNERPIQILKSCFSVFDEVEFHLVRTSLTQNCSFPLDTVNSLVSSINRQQYLINEQSARLNDLVESIRFQESRNENKLNDEYIKRRLFHLELKSKLNERKIKKILDSNDYSEQELRREAELNEFLRAQIDYYQRKLDSTKFKLESLEREYEQLSIDCQMLSSNVNSEENYYQAVRQFEMNRAKLNYLDATILSLDENLSQKKELCVRLENELDRISGNPQTCSNILETIWMSDCSSETESSSESISNALSDAGGRHKSPDVSSEEKNISKTLQDIYFF